MELTDLARLPGAADKNFEALTRAIVSRRYGRLGTLRERRNQPGVEFYLHVEHPGVLGDPGRVWGWSCKWFILGKDNELTSAQRSQIEDSVAKAIKYVAGLTDFVLCLPQRPAKTVSYVVRRTLSRYGAGNVELDRAGWLVGDRQAADSGAADAAAGRGNAEHA
ncbi:hypothetical protein [Streptomyces xinghaiensis]|uniref:hypothetical protein n=1 Tax=Streptomyces xinghaiensis TaxID=1038928 RepID=UPI002E148159|nr:hypothetical protein OG463_25245 [Streptomyces xinghaiensis]